MKKWIVFIALAALCTAGLAHAQCSSDSDEICIFWDPGGVDCINCMTAFGMPVDAYVVLMNPSYASGVGGFEFELTNADGSYFMPPPSDFIMGYIYPPAAINAAAPPVFIVGLGAPIPYSPIITLLTINMLIFDPSPWCFGVKPIDYASMPGHMIYVPGHNPGLLTPMYPCTGPAAPDYGMACLNSSECPPPIATDKTTWDGLKSLYR